MLKEKLIQIFGRDYVLDDPEICLSYASDQSFSTKMTPWFVVKPQNVIQIHELVNYANKTKTPLIPISSGAPHYKGDTVPSVPRSIIVDLSHMKKIININRQQRIAIVEPGVTYGELLKALQKEGLTISTPFAPKAEKSVLASVLDMEPRLNSLHQWNFIDPLRCAEVIWGDGNRMFTGEAGGSSMDLKKQWNEQKWQVSGTGPMMLDFYRLLTGSQGSIGIVTWISLKCEVNTKIHKFYIVPAKKVKYLHDFVHKVLKSRFSNELMIVNAAYLASLLGDSYDQVKNLMSKLPQWMALVGIAGRELLPEEKVNAQEQDISDIARQYDLSLLPDIAGINGMQILEKVTNPSDEKYWKETYKGSFQDVFFTTTLENTSQFIENIYSLAEENKYPTQDIGVYLQPQNMGTCYHCEFSLPYNEKDKYEVEKVKKLFIKSSEHFSKLGAYYLRPHGIWSKLQLQKDAQSTIYLRNIKNIFDPNNIMNPGKLCI